MTSVEDSDVDRWINQTTREDICADHNWAGMEVLSTSETTTAGTGIKTWPTPSTYKDTLWIQVLRDASSNYTDLDEMSEEQILDRDNFSELTAARSLPRYWARSGTSYLLRPIPDATYTLRVKYLAYPADIATGAGSDSSTNFLTLYWSKVLELGVTARGCKYYGEADWAQMYSQEFANALGAAIARDRRNNAPAKMTLKPSEWAGKAVAGLRGVGRRTRSTAFDWYP